MSKLTGRFRILMEERKSRYFPLKVALFSNACAALHNICIHFKVNSGFTLDNEIQEEFFSNIQKVNSLQHSTLKRIGETQRNRIAVNL